MSRLRGCVTGLVLLCSAGCSDARSTTPSEQPNPAGSTAATKEADASVKEPPATPLTVLASGEDPPQSLAIDERYVYWTTRTELRRAPLTGGTPKTLFSGRSLLQIVAADGGVFVSDGLADTVYRVDRESGASKVIGTGPFPYGIAVRGRSVYWTNKSIAVSGGVLSVANLDDGSTRVLAEGLLQPHAVAADDAFVYFTRTAISCGAVCTAGGVQRLALASGALEVVDSNGTPLDLVLGKRGLYWVGGLPPAVMFAPLPEGELQPLAAAKGEEPGALALDDEALYFSSTTHGRVVKVPLAGGALQPIVTDLGQIGGIAADASWVYVAATSQRQILRVAKDGSAAEPSGPVDAPCPMLLGTAADIAATPRAEGNLEMLALRLDPGRVTASQETFERVVADVTAIRRQQPALADIGHFPRNDGKQLLLGANEVTMKSVRAGDYTAWNCLNEFYGLEELEVGGAYVVLTLKGTYDLELLGQLYTQLPGIQSAQANLSGGDGPTICARRDGESIEYVVDRASGDCVAGCTTHDARAFLSTAPGVVEAKGTWSGQSGSGPEWFTRICQR